MSALSVDQQDRVMDRAFDIASRMVLICKPEQSGKTFIMIEQINHHSILPPSAKPVVNFVFCDNNLLLTLQTSRRFKDVRVSDSDTNYLEFSSHKRTDYKSSVAVYGGICMRKIYNVLCCTNGKRVPDIAELVTSLSEKFTIKIWLDEADKYHNYVESTFKPLVEQYPEVSLYCITATPGNLFMKFGEFNVFPIQDTTREDYHGWKENTLDFFTLKCGTVDFAEHVLKHVLNQDLILPDTRWFIPADSKKSSHHEMAEMCSKYGFATIIVNGDGIRCILPNRRTKLLKKDKELNQLLVDIYKDKDLNLVNYPVAVTGYLCVGRGISIMSEDFMFDYGILSATHNPHEASQNAGRLKGNIKSFQNYKAPYVFTTPEFDKIATEWEAKSRSLAKIAYAKQSDGDSTIIDNEEFQGIGRTGPISSRKPTPKISEVFPSCDDFASSLSPTLKEKYLQFQGRTLYTEAESQEAREIIRAYLGKYEILRNTTAATRKFRKLDKRFYELQADGTYKYSPTRGEEKKLWKPEDITRGHVSIIEPKPDQDIHKVRVIERRPTYITEDGVNHLRYKIFYYDGVTSVSA